MPREYRFYVYIMAGKSRRIYTGVTNNIQRRIAQYKRGEIEGFTERYKSAAWFISKSTSTSAMPSAARSRALYPSKM